MYECISNRYDPDELKFPEHDSPAPHWPYVTAATRNSFRMGASTSLSAAWLN